MRLPIDYSRMVSVLFFVLMSSVIFFIFAVDQNDPSRQYVSVLMLPTMDCHISSRPNDCLYGIAATIVILIDTSIMNIENKLIYSSNYTNENVQHLFRDWNEKIATKKTKLYIVYMRFSLHFTVQLQIKTNKKVYKNKNGTSTILPLFFC